MATWMDGYEPTRYPGIFRNKKDKTDFRVRVRAIDPRTGMQKEVNRRIIGIDVETALRKQLELRSETKAPPMRERMRVGDFAKLWIESKAATVDEGTITIYVEALENHALPALGNFYFDEVRSMDVQAWINAELRKGYRVSAVHCFFRAFRTMVRDAIVQLELPRDPTDANHIPRSWRAGRAECVIDIPAGSIPG
jgi:Phage integrase, N-terminal SAM-like domain